MSILQLRLFISGAEYGITDDYQIREKVGQVDQASVTAKITDTDPLPISKQSLYITLADGTTKIFSGIIEAVDSPVWSSGYEVYLVQLTVKSIDVIFDYRIINESFIGMTVTEIIQYIYDNYLSEDGITQGTIQEFDRYFEKYVCSALTMRSVLDELGDSVNAVPHIDENGVFSFCDSTQFPEMPIPDKLTKLQQKENGSKLVTVQRLSGANEETSLQTESITWALNQANFTLSYQISSITGITINGSTAGFGIRGVDEADTTKTFLYRVGENIISINPNAAVKPVASDLVVCVYNGYFSIEIIQENESLKNEIAGLNGTSGRIESTVVDTSITSFADGYAKAVDLLDQKSEREKEISVRYRGEDLSVCNLLTAWDFNFADLDIEGIFIIVERTIRYFADMYDVQLKLKNKNFYSRQGTVLFQNNKQINNLSVRTEDTVYKTSNVYEVLDFIDEYTISISAPVVYPVESGGSLWSPSNINISGVSGEFGCYPV